MQCHFLVKAEVWEIEIKQASANWELEKEILKIKNLQSHGSDSQVKGFDVFFHF